MTPVAAKTTMGALIGGVSISVGVVA